MKKRLSSLLILALVFTMLTPMFALAATPADVEGGKYESAVAQLGALGILNGYPDGTFKPENEITRAEFAKIVAYAAGFAGSAEYLGQVNTSFTDVTSTHWASGYIQVASNKGYLKGYPDGTFKPNNKVTYGEVATVLLRVLGYDDRLTGTWPSDYIIQAEALDIISDEVSSSFSASKSATRGDVAVLTNNTLYNYTVAFDKDTDRFIKSSNEVLFTQVFDLYNYGWVWGVLSQPSLDNKDNVYLTVTTSTGTHEIPFETSSLEVVGYELEDLLGHNVGLLYGKNGEVLVDDNNETVSGTLKAAFTVPTPVANTAVVIDLNENKTTNPYDVYTDAKFFINGQEAQPGDVIAEDANVTFFLDEFGFVRFVVAEEWHVSAKVVDSVTAATTYKYAKVTLDDTTSFSVRNDAEVTLDGAPAKVTDIKENNVVYARFIDDAKGISGKAATVVEAYSKKVTGMVTSMTTKSGNKVTVNGQTYGVTAAAFADIEVGNTYDLLLNKDGVVVKAIVLEDQTTDVIGVFSKTGSYTPVIDGKVSTQSVKTVELFDLETGKELTFDILKKDGVYQSLTDVDVPLQGDSIETGDIVKLVLDANGKVKEVIELEDQVTVVDTIIYDIDGSKVSFGTEANHTNYYLVNSGTTVVDVYSFNESTPDGSDLALAEFANLNEGDSVHYVPNTNGLTIDYIFADEKDLTATAADSFAGVFESRYSVRTQVDGVNTTVYYVDVNVDGVIKTVVYESWPLTTVAKGEAISLIDSDKNGKYEVTGTNVTGTQTFIGATDAVGSFSLTSDGTKYITTEDTLFYVVEVDSLVDNLDNLDPLTTEIFVGQFADVEDIAGAGLTGTKIAVVAGDVIGGYTVADVVVIYQER